MRIIRRMAYENEQCRKSIHNKKKFKILVREERTHSNADAVKWNKMHQNSHSFGEFGDISCLSHIYSQYFNCRSGKLT